MAGRALTGLLVCSKGLAFVRGSIETLGVIVGLAVVPQKIGACRSQASLRAWVRSRPLPLSDRSRFSDAWLVLGVRHGKGGQCSS